MLVARLAEPGGVQGREQGALCRPRADRGRSAGVGPGRLQQAAPASLSSGPPPLLPAPLRAGDVPQSHFGRECKRAASVVVSFVCERAVSVVVSFVCERAGSVVVRFVCNKLDKLLSALCVSELDQLLSALCVTSWTSCCQLCVQASWIGCCQLCV